jgi:hypothetical protein
LIVFNVSAENGAGIRRGRQGGKSDLGRANSPLAVTVQIAELAARYKVPAMYVREYVAAGA